MIYRVFTGSSQSPFFHLQGFYRVVPIFTTYLQGQRQSPPRFTCYLQALGNFYMILPVVS